MKNHKWVVAVLAALVVSMPVFAQSANSLQGKQFSKKQLSEMDRKLVRSVKAAREKAPKCIWCGRTITDENQYTKCPQDPDVLCCPGKQTAAPAATCVRCGETYHRGQHCKAADYNALCTTQAEEKQPSSSGRVDNPFFKGGDPHNDANYEKCRTCGEPITDEHLYRRCPQDPDVVCLPAPKTAQPAKPAKCRTCGEPVAEGSYRRCPQDPDVMCLPAPKDASKDYTCYRCGKSFRPGQHCAKADYNALCAKDKAQEQALEKAEQERQQEAAKASVCPKCGEEYTIDERYHGVQHQCQK